MAQPAISYCHHQIFQSLTGKFGMAEVKSLNQPEYRHDQASSASFEILQSATAESINLPSEADLRRILKEEQSRLIEEK